MPLLQIQTDGILSKIDSKPVALERDIQRLIEKNLPESLDIEFVASEYCIQGGRMDTLGIDQNGSPVIIEYKKGGNSSVISQAAFYFAWLIDHKESFEKLVEKAGIEKKVSWDSPRLLCMSETFNFYDYSAIKMLRVRVELLKYRFYGDTLLYLTPDRPIDIEERMKGKSVKLPSPKTSQYSPDPFADFDAYVGAIPEQETQERVKEMREFVLGLSSEIQEKVNRRNISYRTAMLFCDIAFPKKDGSITVFFPNKLISEDIIDSLPLKQGKNQSTMRIIEKEDIEIFKKIVEGTYQKSV